MTAMDFRQYDNALGRFNVIDPLAEQDFSNSPYAFAGNDPVLHHDPSGLKFRAPDEGGLGVNNPFSDGGAAWLFASGMSGTKVRDALEQQAWGPNFQIRAGGGGVDYNPNGGHWVKLWKPSDDQETYTAETKLPNGVIQLSDVTIAGKWIYVWVSDNSKDGSSAFDSGKVGTATAITADNTALAIDVAKLGGNGSSLKSLSKKAGIFGAILGVGTAAVHMYHHGYNNSDMLSIGLGVGAGLMAVFAPETVAWEIGSVVLDGAIMTKDIYDASNEPN